MARVRTRATVGVASLAIVAGCIDLGSDWGGDWNWDVCQSDDDCPAGEICTGFFGGCTAGTCDSDEDCPAHDECRLRGSWFEPGSPTRTTCETRICYFDDDCPDPYVCDKQYCAIDLRICHSDLACSPDEVCGHRPGHESDVHDKKVCLAGDAGGAGGDGGGAAGGAGPGGGTGGVGGA